MVGNWFKTFKIAPRLSRKDWLLTIVPTLIWLGAFNAREYTLKTTCAQFPETCQPANVNFADRDVVQYWSPQADWNSNWTQYSAGALAIAAPAIWLGANVVGGQFALATAAVTLGADLLLMLQATVWNGAANEMIKIAVQRPRPFVYRNPSNEGKSFNAYSSFYSGHTSFAAGATASLIITLIARSAPLWFTLMFGLCGAIMTFVTGTLRVVAGVHFYSDVVFGFFAGIIIAIMIQKIHRDSKSKLTTSSPML